VQRIEDGVAGDIEFVERFEGEDAGAMHGIAGDGVFLEDRDVKAATRELSGGVQPAGTASDDGDVVHQG
jgi:hypothetical protein